jgi:hypothetical protein
MTLAACANLRGAPIPEPDGGAEGGAEGGAATDASPPSDAGAMNDAVTDVGADEDAAPVIMKTVGFHVEYNGPVSGASVTVLAPAPMSTATDASGDFKVTAPLGSVLVVKVQAAGLLSMIRGIVVGATNRIRTFYLAGPPEQQAAQSLGHSFDPAKGIVEVDFRNATTGGYGAKLTSGGGAALVPGFGIALDATGTPQSSTVTLAGGDGSTLLLGDVPPAIASFAPIVPSDAGQPCQPCDAPSLPIQAGAVTWFDFECGTATDCK